MFGYEYEEDTRFATEAEAHVEWHLNAGVPMGTPGCPQDACHPDEHEMPTEHVFTHGEVTAQYEATDALRTLTGPFETRVEDDDDLPF